ncbi:hypothetical protein KsCSTR_05870 [Candidatus Kuenenia stuttgartiensis]|uniref:Transposase n=1 Tax=Kuenenia stuttgartiensis TaxID=174633 RepID=Q1Q001_KUEST|nr:hypothetical protein KsCSTR_05870 [Candidatus Kuenenia stuttgartiensis]CAJ72653.1 unknown protein [Candidatus Kuenenia stuttgartiensis]
MPLPVTVFEKKNGYVRIKRLGIGNQTEAVCLAQDSGNNLQSTKTYKKRGFCRAIL